MKHATSRILFAYWDTLRGERSAPERAEIEPGAIRHVLADTFILGAEQGASAAYRAAGTRCCALFGRDLKGVPFHAAWPQAGRAEADGLVATVALDLTGLVVGLVGANENGSEVALELLLLPLRHGGRTGSRLLGALSPVTLPSWAGLVPLRALETRSSRAVRTGWEGAGLTAGAPASRTRLVVHEGGRAGAARIDGAVAGPRSI